MRSQRFFATSASAKALAQGHDLQSAGWTKVVQRNWFFLGQPHLGGAIDAAGGLLPHLPHSPRATSCPSWILGIPESDQK